MKRFKTKYPGVYYTIGTSRATGKQERIYYINYRRSGKRIEEKAGRQFSDDMTSAKANRIRSMRIEGKQLSNEERRTRDSELKLERNVWTLDKLWNEYHYQKSAEGIKSLRTDVYKYNKYLSDIFGYKEPREITFSDVDKLRISISKTLKPGSVKNVLTLLKRIMNFGINKQLISPLNFKIQMPTVNNIKTEFLTKEQLSKLMVVLDSESHIPVANVMKMALFTGMRKSELLSLQWNDIDFEQGFIHIRNAKSGIDEKIPLNDSARNVIENQTKTESPYIFPGRSGKKITDIKYFANKLKAKAGLPKDFRPLHGLRHTFASMVASSGQVDMYTLQKLLTHKSPQMTQRYAHLRDETLKKASNLAGELIQSAVNSSVGGL